MFNALGCAHFQNFYAEWKNVVYVGCSGEIYVHHVTTKLSKLVVSTYITPGKLIQTSDLYLRQWRCTQKLWVGAITRNADF